MNHPVHHIKDGLTVPDARKRGGFTLVEIMIVVMIIGLLATLALPGFARAREISQIYRTMNDLRVIADSFEVYAMENGEWPADQGPGVFPPEMEGYLRESYFTSTTPIGGLFDWDPQSSTSKPSGVAVAVSIRGHHLSEEKTQDFVDRFGAGNFALLNDGSIFYVLEWE